MPIDHGLDGFYRMSVEHDFSLYCRFLEML